MKPIITTKQITKANKEIYLLENFDFVLLNIYMENSSDQKFIKNTVT